MSDNQVAARAAHADRLCTRNVTGCKPRPYSNYGVTPNQILVVLGMLYTAPRTLNSLL